MFTENLALVKSDEPAGRIGDFGNFLNGFAKSPRVLCTVLNIECLEKLRHTAFCPRSV